MRFLMIAALLAQTLRCFSLRWSNDVINSSHTGGSVVSVEDLVFIAGGRNGGDVSSSVHVLDAVLGNMSDSSLSVARDDIAAVAVSGRILVFAGGCGDQALPVDAVDIYDVRCLIPPRHQFFLLFLCSDEYPDRRHERAIFRIYPNL